MPEQFVSGAAGDEGEMDAQAAAQGIEGEMFPMEEGYFSNLMNQNTNLMFDDVSSLPDDPPAPVVVSTPSSRRNQGRSKNFSDKEDSLIVSAWLNISMDPVYGTNQTRGTFWKRVHAFYHKYKDFESDRTQSSISHRWASIQENVNKFCGCLARIEDRKQSGVTFQDKLVQALALFKQEDNDKKSFQFMHCWNQLRNQPKWQEKRRLIDTIKQAPNKKAKANMSSCPGTATPINVDSGNKDIVENACPEADAPKRPIGKKKAKEALWRGMQGEAYKEASEHFWGKKREFDAEKEKKKEERFNQSYELEKDRLRLDEKRAEMEGKN
ncbi:hypothetical protein U9M48_041946 [Paspalum notatum var. saurae]|uniref:No apical meristem-associated C-terminal domain-containing protein n=1 Tax=Paspalum notatum var. saurae TaxID=547442 RepID=A0AAQ3UU50_PASNO